MNRRDFLRLGICAMPAAVGTAFRATAGHYAEADRFTRKARFFRTLPRKMIQCTLCPHQCVVLPGRRGTCRVRENRNGQYFTLVYGRACALHVDPVEKKPFFHYKPGTLAYSIATTGCNFDCRYCQNWAISQARPETVKAVHAPPSTVVREAAKYGCKSIAFTYTEPVVFYEYMYDTAAEGRKASIPGIMISNGFIMPEPMKRLCTVLDAVKIDFKGFSEKFYRDVCEGELKPVLDTMKLIHGEGKWLEIVVLVIPTLNDREENIRAMSKWIAKELSPHVPVHFSRFRPTYKLRNLPPTPVRTLERCRDIAMRAGLAYVYIGNVPGHAGEQTYCHRCGKKIVGRVGFSVTEMHIENGKCAFCGERIPGIWS